MGVLNNRTQRAQRDVRSSGSQEFGDAQRYSRVQGESGPSYATESRHYRKDYGTSLDDTQYQGAEDNRRQFESAMAKGRSDISRYRGQLSSARDSLSAARAQADAGYASGKSQIGSFSGGNIPTYDDWASTQGQVHIYSGGEYQYSFNLTSDAVHGIAGKIQDYNKNNDGDIDMTQGDRGINLDVHGYGAEISEDLAHAQAMTRTAFDTAVANAKGTISSQKSAAYNSLNSQYSSAIGSIQEEEGRLGIAQANITAATNRLDATQKERTSTLNGIKKKYSDRLSRIKESIGAVVMKGAMAKKAEGEN